MTITMKHWYRTSTEFQIKCSHCSEPCTDPECSCIEFMGLDCIECANTRRQPIPFTEVWGI